jgi:hypothetical protein
MFFTTFVWNIFDSKKNWARYGRKIYIVRLEDVAATKFNEICSGREARQNRHISTRLSARENFIITNIVIHTKYPLFLSDFNETWISPDRF